MKVWLASISLLAVHHWLLASQQPGATPRKSAEAWYAASYNAGVAEADKELEEGTATIYAYGERHAPVNHIDWETGLPYESIAGCTVTERIKARANGHNDRIRRYVEERGLPRNSFKPWSKELSDLNGYYKTRARIEGVHRLSRDGPVVKSSDGKYAVRLVKARWKRLDGGFVDVSSVVVSVNGVDRKPFVTVGLMKRTHADLLWGPKGSGFAVIHPGGDGESSSFAVDLNRGKWLR